MVANRNVFSSLAKWTARRTSHGVAFTLAVTAILVWAALGPVFGFSNTWQLVINSFTTIVTFLMIFLLQNSQTRDAEAIQVKLDELIRTQKNAHRALLDLEELDEEELSRIQRHYQSLARKARRHGRGADPLGRRSRRVKA